jgi:hypothetical protein
MKLLSHLIVPLCLVALVACSRSESRWKEAQQLNTVAAYEKYLGDYPDSEYLSDAKKTIESLEWDAALSARDKNRLEALMAKYSNSVNLEKAKDAIWEIQWPPTQVDKANSVSVFKGGEGIMLGQILYSMGAFFGGSGSDPQAAGPNRIVIWRDFAPEELDMATKSGLRAGMAFLKSDDGKYTFVRKVDLAKTDEELAREFGVLVGK